MNYSKNMRKILKVNSSGEMPFELFHSLKTFFLKYPEFLTQKSNIEAYLSRKKKPFETAEFTLYRLSVS
jgi:hypothetical protein